MLNGIHHSQIVCSDLEESLQFYKNLGFDTVRFDAAMTKEDASSVGLMGADQSRAVCLQMNGVEYGMVELVEFQSADGKPLGEESPLPRGILGMSFQYDDVQKKYDELVKVGVEFLTPPIRINVPGFGLAKVAIFFGPDEVAIEIFEKLDEEE